MTDDFQSSFPLPGTGGVSFILLLFTHTQVMTFVRSDVSGEAGTVALVSKQ